MKLVRSPRQTINEMSKKLLIEPIDVPHSSINEQPKPKVIFHIEIKGVSNVYVCDTIKNNDYIKKNHN